MDIQAFEEFINSIKLMTNDEIFFLYAERENGIQTTKAALDAAQELAKVGERRIALENLLDNLSEVGIILSAKQLVLADKAFGSQKNKSEQVLLDYYKEHLIR